jgi:aminoglycoside phosphotransferase (APT) family kinase protein
MSVSGPGLLTEESAPAYLRARGVIGDGPATVEALGGGVSNVVLAITSGQRRVVLKQALPRLRVEREWLAKRERALAEARALTRARTILDAGSVPEVLDVDPARCALTIERAPTDWLTWKELLFAGEIQPEIAGQLGGLLADWHGGTSAPGPEFDEWDSFEQLRVDPYYRETARRHPALAGPIMRHADAMRERRACLVHGDFSPKNILVGDPGLWVIDFEVAHLGDPAFDLAFMLTHLFLKSIAMPPERPRLLACAERFDAAYRAGHSTVAAPAPAYVLGHVGCLMLARVDGKSPAEYLDEAARARTRDAAIVLIAGNPNSLADAARAIEEAA